MEMPDAEALDGQASLVASPQTPVNIPIGIYVASPQTPAVTPVGIYVAATPPGESPVATIVDFFAGAMTP